MNQLNSQLSAHTIQPTDAEAFAAAEVRWYVMRDLKRANAKEPAYLMLDRLGFNVFTPMIWKNVPGRRSLRQVPAMADLLFVRSSRLALDPVVGRTPTLQYRFGRGLAYRTPMQVREDEMERFINALEPERSPQFYSEDQIRNLSVGRSVRIISDRVPAGLEGRILKVRGARTPRVLVEIPGLIAASIEVPPHMIEFIDN